VGRHFVEETNLCVKRGVIACAIPIIAIVWGVNASPKGQSEKTQIVASVGNGRITLRDFSDRYEDYLIFAGLQDNLQARYAILNNMINEILLRQYDDNSKIYGNLEYKKEIASARNRSILAFLKDREVYAKITVTDRELREAYQRSKIKLAVRHLYTPTEKEAENLYNLATMGVSFDELAKQVFTDTTLRNNGGYLGYIGWGDTDPNFENVAYSLKPGEISRPVKTPEGYSIIRVDDRIEDPITTENDFLNQKRKLERALKIDKKKGAEEAYLEKVFDKKRVRFNEKALNTVLSDLKNSISQDVESAGRTNQAFAYCVEYKGRKYGKKEIERKILETPEYNRSLLRDANLLKEAVTGLIMQDVLMGIARGKGYDTTSYVHETFTKLANDVYLNYKRNEILDIVPVADSEVVQYYGKNISYYTREREMNVQEIIVDNDSLAAAIREKIDRGEDFGALATKYSLRKWSAKNKGVLGLSPISHFGNMKDTLWNLAAGEVLGPLKFDKYFGIFQVLSRINSQPIAIDLVRDQIVKAIKNEKGFPYMKERLARLSKGTTIKVDDDAIKSYTMNVAGK
jgi:parvulin-like peptidyl-prolyl isomerase